MLHENVFAENRGRGYSYERPLHFVGSSDPVRTGI